MTEEQLLILKKNYHEALRDIFPATLYKAAERMFPGRWYLQKPGFEGIKDGYSNRANIPSVNTIRDYLTNNVKLIIHYPEFTITNSESRTHVIKNLFVIIWPNYYLTGLRTTFTPEEVACKYAHSHLNPEVVYNRCRDGSNFCLGDSELGILLQFFRGNQEELTEDNFCYMLTLLDQYIHWESLEGGPYKHISNIVSTDKQKVCNISERDYWFSRVIIRKFLSNNNKINITVLPNKIEVIDDDTLEESLLNFSNDIRCRISNEVICEKNIINNQYYKRVLTDYTIYEREIKFRNQIFKTEVVSDNNTEDINNYKQAIHPTFKRWFAKTLSEILTKTYFENPEFRSFSGSYSHREPVEQDQIPMLQD